MKLNIEKLKLILAEKCLTIGELSDISKISRSATTRYFHNKSHPKPITIGRIAQALNVPVTDIIETTERDSD